MELSQGSQKVDRRAHRLQGHRIQRTVDPIRAGHRTDRCATHPYSAEVRESLYGAEPAIPGLRRTTKEQLTAGHDVVVDHGFWTPEDRAKWRSIAIDAGAIPVLAYLAASHEELWARISQGNEQHGNDPNAIYFSEGDLQRYRTRFIPPQSDEPHLTYDGDSAAVVAALEASRP
ncbi:AAA family ATPase [Streptomyces spororaveus]|uniref:AAA family ATPase n=1 Tax=Streptomyces spororaveus TaxID=284039 RepID=UPI00368A32E0